MIAPETSVVLSGPKAKPKVHKICSNGTASFFALEGDDFLTFKVLSSYPGYDREYIKLRIKNQKLIVYHIARTAKDPNVTRYNKASRIRNITRTCDHLDSFIKTRIKWSTSTEKSKFIRVGKYNKVKKLIADFVRKHLGFKVKKSKFIHELILNVLFPIDDVPMEYKGALCNATYEGKAQCAHSIPEYLDGFLGKKRPKKLNKILYNCIARKDYRQFINSTLAYKHSKGIVDINHIYSALTHENFYLAMDSKVSRKTYYEWRRFIKRLPLRIYLNILTQGVRLSSYTLNDTMRQLAHLPEFVIDSNIRTLQDLHDAVSIAYRRKQNPDFPLKNDEEILVLDNVDVGDMRIVVPKTSYELVEWGARMRNCIASYAKLVNGKQRFLLGISERSELKYNLEINNQTVVQFKGAGNSTPNQDDKKLIVDYLTKEKLIMEHKPTTYFEDDFGEMIV